MRMAVQVRSLIIVHLSVVAGAVTDSHRGMFAHPIMVLVLAACRRRRGPGDRAAPGPGSGGGAVCTRRYPRQGTSNDDPACSRRCSPSLTGSWRRRCWWLLCTAGPKGWARRRRSPWAELVVQVMGTDGFVARRVAGVGPVQGAASRRAGGSRGVGGRVQLAAAQSGRGGRLGSGTGCSGRNRPHEAGRNLAKTRAWSNAVVEMRDPVDESRPTVPVLCLRVWVQRAH